MVNFVKITSYLDSLQFSHYSLSSSWIPSVSYIFPSLEAGLSFSSLTSNDNSLQSSIRRSKCLIKDYLKSNSFDYFVTMTLKDDIRYDITKAMNKFHNSIKYYSTLQPTSNTLQEQKKSWNLVTSEKLKHFIQLERFKQRASMKRGDERRESAVAFAERAGVSGGKAPREGGILKGGNTSPQLCLRGVRGCLMDVSRQFKYLYVFELTKQGGLHLHGFFSRLS